MSLVKICGITEEQEVEYVNEAGVDFMGMVMFFPKSKRNITVEKASSLIKMLNPKITSVAVTVEPTLDQIREIEAAGIQMIRFMGMSAKNCCRRSVFLLSKHLMYMICLLMRDIIRRT